MTEHRALDGIGDIAAEPVTLLVVGGIGMGKSTLLEGIRRRLRETGRTVLARPPRDGDPASAIVIDDAHLLAPEDLRRLAELADDPAATLVIAAEPRDHNPHLRDLMTDLERRRPRITLAPLSSGEMSRLLADPSGHPPPAGVVAEVFAATAGIPLLVATVAGRRFDGGDVARSAFFALAERLRRLDGPQLEALLIVTLSPDLGAADLAAALQLSGDAAYRLIDQARATGLAEPSQPPGFRDAVHRAVAQIVGTARHHEIESALLTTQLASTSLSAELALHLGEHGLRDPGLADALRSQAASHPHDPVLRARIYRAALQAGAGGVRPALAEALALCGQCTAAADLADDLLTSPEPAERAAGVGVAAALAAHDGNTGQAAELFSWLGPYPDAPTATAAVIAHLGCGDTAAAHAALSAEHAGPPTAAARAARSLADGLLMTITDRYPAAAVKLGQAAAGERSAGVPPDSTAALVTLAALHNGDTARARSVVARAVTDAGDPLFVHRHRLLQAWIRMQEGQLTVASADADIPVSPDLHRRDALWTAALRTAVARRGGDAGSLRKHWYDGMEALAGFAVDLYALLPLAELWMAAARLHQADRMAPFLDQGFGVLAALGDPPAWSLPLHWAGVHAGILCNDPAAVAPHGQALAAAAATSPFGAALAAAGRTWLRVLARQVDAEEVIAAARGLARFGLTSDATRLAGQAALSTTEPKVSAVMLQVARDLKVANAEPGPAGSAAEPDPATRAHRPSSAALSDREREVAELLLLGMPYRDIGAQLFISAKTVEHHVARIRRRLGAQSRSEMLSMLRAVTEPTTLGRRG